MEQRKITPIHFTKLIKVFELDGFRIKRQKGDHISMVKPGIKRPIIIKTSPHNIPITHIRTNMTTAGMSREKYFELLGKVK